MDQASVEDVVQRVISSSESAQARPLKFLLLGRAGVGKSSTVNTLMGYEVAPVGHYEPQTVSIKSYDCEIHGVRCAFIDTPGLCDDLPEVGKDSQYLELVRRNVPTADCVWFVTPLNEKRVRLDEKTGIKLISEALGPRMWEHAVIIFTFADLVPPDKYLEALAERTRLIRKEISRYAGTKVAENIPSVAVSNISSATPDGKLWLNNLYTLVLTRIADGAVLPFVLLTSHRVHWSRNSNTSGELSDEEWADLFLDTNERLPVLDVPENGIDSNSSRLPVLDEATKIVLTEAQEKTLIARLSTTNPEIIGGLTAAGVTIGSMFGPAGVMMGGVLGATFGVLLWLNGKLQQRGS